MQQIFDAIRDAGGNVLVVSFSTPERLRIFLEGNPLPFPAVADPELAIYRTFGLERTSWLVFFRPDVIGRYLSAMWKGTKLKKPSGRDDLLQLGGDFILDRERRIVFAHASREPTDRPGTDQLLGAIHAAN